MEELPTSKRKRVCTFEPNAILRTNFSHKYIHHLLPALIRIGNDGSHDKNENQEIEKMIRYEVDMALASSASEFAWSQALKHELIKRDVDIKSLLTAPTHPPISLSHLLMDKNNQTSSNFEEKLDEISPLPLVPAVSQSSELSKMAYRRRKKRSRIRVEEEEELGPRIRTLRRILPGGDEMGACELLSQIESYVVCLEQQVSILRTLVDSKGSI